MRVGGRWCGFRLSNSTPPSPTTDQEVKVKVMIHFWSFFFNLRYVKGEVLGYNNIGTKKCRTTFLWVLNFRQVGELPQRFSKLPSRRRFFQKWFLTSRSQRVFLRPNFRFDFFFRINFKGISLVKLKAISIFGELFLIRFILKGISYVKLQAISILGELFFWSDSFLKGFL